MSATRVALLRGINVGGRNKLPMKALRALCEEAGCAAVRTYIQSGNVVFDTPGGSESDGLGVRLAAAIEREYGLRVPVLLRTAVELERIVADNPFVDRGCDPALLHVAFLADAPPADRLARLEPDRSPPDELIAAGRELYLHCPNGMARTKLTNAWLDARLETVSTMRNWRTTLKLLEMARAGA